MNRTILVAIAASLALPAGAISEPGGLSPLLRAPAAEEPAFMLSAEGVHVYQCGVRDGRHLWAFTAPDATLYEGGRSIATHNVPNLWESTSDRSSVTGTVRLTEPNGASNLPLALLRAQPLSETGMFSGVTSIQRVNTSGGVAPAAGCGPDNVGEEARVAFSADYYFYKRRGES